MIGLISFLIGFSVYFIIRYKIFFKKKKKAKPKNVMFFNYEDVWPEEKAS